MGMQAQANGLPSGSRKTAIERPGDEVLSLFWDLASLEAPTRDAAASKLQAAVEESQRQHERGGGGGGAAAAAGLSPLATYALQRLYAGLASSRGGARQGFALALTLVLRALGPGRAPAPAARAALAAALDAPAAGGGGGGGAEARDALLGRAFGLGALVRAGLAAAPADAAAVAAQLLDLAAQKSYLREAAAAVLLELAEGAGADALAAMLAPAAGGGGGLGEWLAAPTEGAPPEALLLALRLWPALPRAAAAACPLLPAGGAAPAAGALTRPRAPRDAATAAAAAAFFTEAHLRRVLPALRASTACHPRRHSVWGAVLALLLPGFSAAGGGAAADGPTTEVERAPLDQVRAFWGVVAEGELLASPSNERKFLALSLAGVLLPRLPRGGAAALLTPGLLRTLGNHAGRPGAALHAAAKKCVERLAAHARGAGPEERLEVALALERHGGAALEAAVLGKKAAAAAGGGLSGPLGGMDAAAAAAYVDTLKEAFAGGAPAATGAPAAGADGDDGGGEGAGALRQQQWAVEQLAAAARHAQTPPDAKLAALAFLAEQAFFEAAPAEKGAAAAPASLPREALPPQVRALCAARLIAAADALSRPPSHAKGGDPAAAAPRNFLAEVVERAEALAAAPGVVVAAGAAGGEAVAALAALRARVLAAQARAAAGAQQQQQRLRALHHLVCLLQLYALGDPAAADGGAAADLAAAFGVAFEGAAPAEGAPHWMDALVDVLLALLARPAAPLPSAPVRDAAEAAFRAFCGDLTATGLADVLRVLGGGDDVAADVDDAEEDDMDTDGSEDAESGSEEEEGDNDDDDDDDDGKAEGEAGASGSDEDAGAAAAGGSGSDSDGGGATDEQMFRLDASLAAHFALVQAGKARARDRRRELLNFRMRAAALVEAYARREPASPLLLAAAAPLLSALAAASRPGGDAPLAERLAGLVRNRLARCRAEAVGAAADPAELEPALRRSLYLASRSADRRLAAAAGDAYVFVQRAAAGAAAAAGGAAAPPLPAARASAAAAVADFFDKKRSRLARGLLLELARRVPTLGADMLPALLERTAGARTEFLRSEALALADAVARVPGAAVAEALRAAAGDVAAAAAAAVRSPPGKAARQAEALKAACHLVEALGQRCGGAALGGADAAALRAAVGDALGAAGAPPKALGQLRRLDGLLQQQAAAPAAGAGKGAATAKKKPAAAKPAAAAEAGKRKASPRVTRAVAKKAKA